MPGSSDGHGLKNLACLFSGVLVHRELKDQPLSICFAWTISLQFHYLASEICIEELGLPHFDFLKNTYAGWIEMPSSSP